MNLFTGLKSLFIRKEMSDSRDCMNCNRNEHACMCYLDDY